MSSRSENTTSVPPTYPQEQEVHLRDYIKVLARRWLLFLSVFAVLFLSITFYSLSSRPLFEAEMLLRVADPGNRGTVLGELSDLQIGKSSAEAEMEILKSRNLAAEVVRTLGMDIQVRSSRDSRFFRTLAGLGLVESDDARGPIITRLSLPPDLLDMPLLLKIMGDGSFSVQKEKETLLQGQTGSAASGNNIGIQIAAVPAPREGNYILVRKDIRRATAALLAGIKVSQMGRGTGIIRVSFQHPDPNSAAEVLGTLGRVQINRDIEETSREAIATLDFITEQLTEVKDRLGKSQLLMDEFKVRTGAVALSQEATLLVQRISDLEVEANRLSITTQGLDGLIRIMTDRSPVAATGFKALDLDSPELALLLTDYTSLLRKRAGILQEYLPESPSVTALQGQIDLVAEQIKATAGALLVGMQKREESVRGILETYRKQLAQLPEMERQLAKLQKDVLIQEKIYSFLLEKEQETRILKASTVSSIRVVDPPTVPIRAVKPQKTRDFLVALILGMIFGVGIVFLRDYMDDTIKDAEDVTNSVKLPLYGTIPFVNKARARRRQRKPHLVIEEPHSPVAEAFRTLRTNILFSRAGDQCKIIVVSSPGPGEGKSFVVANLAALSSLTGRRTLVVDADLRHPQQQIVFGQPQTPGLTEVLMGRATLQEALRSTENENLFLLPAGTLPPNPAELLGAEEMKRFLDLARAQFDLVLFDTPPVGLLTDASLLMNRSDLALLVSMAHRTPLAHLQRCVDTVTGQVQGLRLGIIVNGIRRGSANGYGYYRYAYSRRK